METFFYLNGSFVSCTVRVRLYVNGHKEELRGFGVGGLIKFHKKLGISNENTNFAQDR